jgi:hypothetical protein
MNTRRQFFSRVFTFVTGITGLVACENEKEVIHLSGQLGYTEAKMATLDAVVDAFVPKDQDPGAVEAGVSAKLLGLFHKKDEMKQHGEALLARVELVAQHKHRRPFHRLSLNRREDILHKTFYSLREDDQAARRAIRVLYAYVIEAFYLSPTGQSMLGYSPPYPIGYPDHHAVLSI